jgi:putative protein kinase ArgK-like GTPase of G3E family
MARVRRRVTQTPRQSDFFEDQEVLLEFMEQLEAEHERLRSNRWDLEVYLAHFERIDGVKRLLSEQRDESQGRKAAPRRHKRAAEMFEVIERAITSLDSTKRVLRFSKRVLEQSYRRSKAPF